MKYASGETVKLGDKVSLGQDAGGVVVCNFDTGEYSESHPESQWGHHLTKGVMINFPLYGLIHYEELEPDVKLLARGESSAVGERN